MLYSALVDPGSVLVIPLCDIGFDWGSVFDIKTGKRTEDAASSVHFVYGYLIQSIWF